MMDDIELPKRIVWENVPAETPRAGGALRRTLGRVLLWLSGWRVVGEFPREPRLILAAAPHTSNWDFVVAMMVVMAYNLKISFLMKKEAFIWPLAAVYRRLGGIPIDRTAATDTVGQLVGLYQNKERVWVVITPEGTRSKVEKWKNGFLRVAEQAGVPVCLIGWDYPSKKMHIGPCWPTTGNYDQDLDTIREYFTEKYQGRYPDKQ